MSVGDQISLVDCCLQRAIVQLLVFQNEGHCPNLTLLVGAACGARLIAHAGSFDLLGQGSRINDPDLGAEKALFRALKTKHDTPGRLLYHASLVGQALGKNKRV